MSASLRDIEELLGLAVWAIAVEIRQAKEELMATIDEVTARITTDINNATDALTALRAEIAAFGNTGADVTQLSAAAQKMEDALANAATTATPPPAAPPAALPADVPPAAPPA